MPEPVCEATLPKHDNVQLLNQNKLSTPREPLGTEQGTEPSLEPPIWYGSLT